MSASVVNVTVLACRRSGCIAMRELNSQGTVADLHTTLIEVPCGCAIDEPVMMKALEKGTDAVLALVCYEGSCQSLVGNAAVAKRVGVVREVLKEIAVDRPVELCEVSAASAVRCREALEQIAARVREKRQGGSPG